MMIVSLQNPKIKYVRRLQSSGRFRRQEQAFVAEGTRWLSETVRSECEQRLVLYTEEWGASRDHRQLLDKLSCEKSEVSFEVMKGISELESSEGVIAIVSFIEILPPENPTMFLIADGISDPGNLGTMIRTAAAAGINRVILAPGCVDAYNPKVVRGSMGAHLKIAIQRLSWSQIEAETSQMTNWIAAAGNHVSYDEIDWTSPSSLIIGSEASGASITALKMFNGRVSIPMEREMDSLNVAVAAGVILFEGLRQRRYTGSE